MPANVLGLLVAEIVEGKALLDSVLYSLAAAIGLSIVFSTSLWAATRSAEARRDERHAMAFATGTLMVIGLIACGLAIVLAIIVMTSK